MNYIRNSGMNIERIGHFLYRRRRIDTFKTDLKYDFNISGLDSSDPG
jgi:hypothetical protein